LQTLHEACVGRGEYILYTEHGIYAYIHLYGDILTIDDRGHHIFNGHGSSTAGDIIICIGVCLG